MNIIWIFGDQHRAQALGINGDPNAKTPNIDRLATEGLNFHRAVGGFPLCCPFRGSLISSLYPHKCVPGHEYPLPRNVKTIAHAFQEHNYDTAWFGKWHLGGHHEADGRAAFYTVPREDRGGFQTWIGYDNNNSQWDSWVHGHDTNGNEIERYRLPDYETNCLTDMLIDYITAQGISRKEGNNSGFFAALSVQPPHNPYLAPAEFMNNYQADRIKLRPNVPLFAVDIEETARRDLTGYYAMIENLDWNVGRIRDALSNAELAEETYIIFFSDHGDMHGSQGQFRKTCPWEEAIRIPFIISGGPSIYQCQTGRSPYPVNHVDIAPTTLGLCGLDIPEWMTGFDYSACFQIGKELNESPPDSAFIQSVIPTMHGDSIDRPWRGIVTVDGWKYVCLERQPWLLYNLNDDPYEQVNLAHNSRYASQRGKLQQRLAQWLEETEDRFKLPK